MVLRYEHNETYDRFVADERPAAVQESNDQLLRQLLEQNPGITSTSTKFQNAAMVKGVTEARARSFLNDRVASGWITQAVGRHNTKCHWIASQVPQQGSLF